MITVPGSYNAVVEELRRKSLKVRRPLSCSYLGCLQLFLKLSLIPKLPYKEVKYKLEC